MKLWHYFKIRILSIKICLIWCVSGWPTVSGLQLMIFEAKFKISLEVALESSKNDADFFSSIHHSSRGFRGLLNHSMNEKSFWSPEEVCIFFFNFPMIITPHICGGMNLSSIYLYKDCLLY